MLLGCIACANLNSEYAPDILPDFKRSLPDFIKNLKAILSLSILSLVTSLL